jgi:hypothetical protein
MSTYGGNRPILTAHHSDDINPVTPPDVPFMEERSRSGNQLVRWFKSEAVRDKATAALKYAERHPRQMMVATLALGLMVGALRRSRGGTV